jgi:hypothetical protein
VGDRAFAPTNESRARAKCSNPGTSALAPATVVLAYLGSTAILAFTLAALLGADARPHALLAPAPGAVMLAYLRSAAFLAVRGHVGWAR